MSGVFGNVGVEIGLAKPDSFNIIRETLTRIGISSKNSNVLYQTAHILHKKGNYAILHFKELFILDGKDSSITEEDIARRNTIVKLLKEWHLITLLDEQQIAMILPVSAMKIVSYNDKNNWQLTPKYTIGKK